MKSYKFISYRMLSLLGRPLLRSTHIVRELALYSQQSWCSASLDRKSFVPMIVRLAYSHLLRRNNTRTMNCHVFPFFTNGRLCPWYRNSLAQITLFVLVRDLWALLFLGDHDGDDHDCGHGCEAWHLVALCRRSFWFHRMLRIIWRSGNGSYYIWTLH